MSRKAARVQWTGIAVDTSLWPLVLVRYHGGITDQQFAAYLEQRTEMLQRGDRFALILDATHAAFPPQSHVRMQAAWLGAHHDELIRLNAGVACVIPSSVFRAVVSAVFVLQPPPVPHHVCRSTREAIEWTSATLGVEPPLQALAWDDEEITQPTARVSLPR